MPCNFSDDPTMLRQGGSMASLRIILGAVLSATLIWTNAASAEYDGAKLRQVAGGYLDAVHVVTQLQQSGCGGYVRNEDSFANAMGDVAGYLHPDDVQELQSFLT